MQLTWNHPSCIKWQWWSMMLCLHKIENCRLSVSEPYLRLQCVQELTFIVSCAPYSLSRGQHLAVKTSHLLQSLSSCCCCCGGGVPPTQRRPVSSAGGWLTGWLADWRTHRLGGNVMDERTPSEAARRFPQMAEWVRMRLPSSIFVSVSLFTAETTAALYLSSTYRSAGDQIWQGLTLLFTLVPSVLVQLTLTFIHRDLSRDRPLILLLHILQLGPIVRSVGACCLFLFSLVVVLRPCGWIPSPQREKMSVIIHRCGVHMILFFS